MDLVDMPSPIYARPCVQTVQIVKNVRNDKDFFGLSYFCVDPYACANREEKKTATNK